MNKIPALDRLIKDKRRRQILRSLKRFLLHSFLWLCVIVLGLWLLVQNQTFQNWAIKQVTTALSSRLDTKVTIDRLTIDLFDQLVFEKFYVEDAKGDTLLYSGSLSANFNTSLRSIIGQRLEVNEIRLEDTDFYMLRDAGSFENNIQILLERLIDNNNKEVSRDPKKASSFEVDLDKLHLKNIHFYKNDALKGQELSIFLEEGEILLDKLDISNKQIEISSVKARNPIVRITDYARDEEALAYWDCVQAERDSLKQLLQIDKPSTTFYTILVDDLDLTNGIFTLNNFRKEPIKDTPDDVIDYQHLNVQAINIAVDSFAYANEVYTGRINALNCVEQSGFILDQLTVEDATISREEIVLNGLNLLTPYSEVGDTLVAKMRNDTYEDFNEFTDNVWLNAKFNKAKLAIQDVMTFAPKLEENAFFRKNKKEIVYINGQIKGKINSLKGRDLDILLGNNTYLRGKFDTRNLAIRNEEFISMLELERLRTDMKTLKLLIPNFNLPDNFYKLGNLDFEGSFTGFFSDFVATGKLNTDLGRAEIDMNLKTREGRANAVYGGTLALIDFDLARWADNPDFGIVSFRSDVKEGKGLTQATAEAKLVATVERFPYRDYVYENMKMHGALKQNFFNGDFTIKDENIDFSFIGEVDFAGALPKYDFQADIKQLALKKLNLSKQDLELSGDVKMDLSGDNLSNIEGDISLLDFNIKHNQKNNYKADTINAIVRIDDDGNKQLNIDSDIFNLKLSGDFDIPQIPAVFQNYLVEKYAPYAEQFNIKASNNPNAKGRFDFDARIDDSKNFTSLIHPDLGVLKDISLSGHIDNERDSLKLDLNIPYLKYRDLEIEGALIDAEAGSIKNDYIIKLDQFHQGDKTRANASILYAHMEEETLLFNFNTNDLWATENNVNIVGSFFKTPDDLFQISFVPSNFILLNQEWSIGEDNYIRFGKNRIETNNFQIKDENNHLITLNSEGENGLILATEGFDLAYVNDLWTYDKLIFDGNLSAEIYTSNAFKLSDVSASVYVDTFWVNDDDWGTLQIGASLDSLREKVDIYTNITRKDESRQLIVEGYYALPKKEQTLKTKILSAKKTIVPNTLDLDLTLNNYPLNIAEYFLGDGLSETSGRFAIKAKLKGPPKKLDLSGNIDITNGEFKINYLGVHYYLYDRNANNQNGKTTQSAIISNTLFDITGATIWDRMGNTARVTGGITHDHLRDLGLDAFVETDRFLALDTQKEDNPTYYGQGIGSGLVYFSGDFKQPNISATVTAGADSKLIIPVNSERDGSEVSFIKFIDRSKQDSLAKDKKLEFRGVNLDLNLTMNELAETQLVFDERSGDILKGRGDGNIRLSITRTGDFNMYGNYDVQGGEYLFTYKFLDQNIINKPFDVKRGGTIRWYGDPFAAQIDIQAEYKGLSTSPYNLISEYIDELSTEELKSEARQTTPVGLTMNLKGALLKPDISFDINFPTSSGELSNYIDNKMRLLKQDANELNRQVFGLIVIGGFLPSSDDAITSQTGVLVSNTFSQVLSNQLSMFLTELIQQSLAEDGLLSNVDFDINYMEYSATDLDNARGRELSLRPRFYFLNDRLSVDVGGNIGLGNNLSLQGATSTFNSGDFIIEYALTENRRLKVRVYNRYEQNIDGARYKYGVGMSYRREFDDFSEFLQSLKKTAKDTKNKKKNKRKKNKNSNMEFDFGG